MLFERHGILDAIRRNGLFEISSAQINNVREARLMTKFDHRANLPRIFSDNGLAILPITRGSYLIGGFDAYFAQPPDSGSAAVEFEFPSHLESISPGLLYSEAAAVNCAYACGMINEIAGEETLPTVSGRMGTSKFAFRINKSSGEGFHDLTVENSQCEIDGGFEGRNVLVLLEAKNSVCDDFITRQLYYPYRLWSKKTAKKVMPVFLSYSNDVFHFFIYEFLDEADYNSISLVRRANYTVSPEKITLEDIRSVLDAVEMVDEPEEPFPQADRFERVVDLLGLLMRGDLEGQDITENYDFDPRQTQYYSSAGRYLELMEQKEPGLFGLSKRGSLIMNLGCKPKYMALVKAILRHKVFNRVCRAYLENGGRPANPEVVEIMKGCNLYRVGSESTFKRRSQTVIKWIEWILELQRK